MAEGTLNRVREQVQHNPGTDRLKEELQNYAQARLDLMLEGMGERLGEGARRLAETHVGPGALTKIALKGGKKLLSGAGPGEMLSQAKDTLLGKAKEATEGKKNKPPSDAIGRGLTIVEEVDVGVPVREAYNQWTQFTDFDRFAKGVEDVRQDDEITTHWQAKIAKSRRHWKATVTEQVPDERIAWTTEGPKGTNKGVVTFHPLGDNLTKVLLVLQYFPRGLFEKTGSLWRAQGRRVRLDLKLYRAFVMSRGEATGAWRGEIRDGEVVRSPEEVERSEAGEDEEEGREEEPEERYDEDEEEEEPEDAEPEGEPASEVDAEEVEDDEWEEDEDEQPEDRYDEREAPAGRRRRG